jgi:hypothetical protein
MRPIYFVDVQREILEQHEEIRVWIHGLQRNAERIDIPCVQDAIRILLRRFAAHFDAHLAFEERELAPRIRALDAWGIEREAALRAEHRDQRRRLERVCALAEDASTVETMALFDEVSALADSLLEDMLVEERTISELARIDEHGHVDQMTG